MTSLARVAALRRRVLLAVLGLSRHGG